MHESTTNNEKAIMTDKSKELNVSMKLVSERLNFTGTVEGNQPEIA
jgi:hypothetical protein